MSIAAPPAWVLALELDSGSWRCLVGLWSWADYGATGPAHVWPTREQLAERTGQTVEAVKKQLRKLAAEGLAEPHARGWVLAWRGQASPDGGPQSPARGPASPGNPVPAEGATVPGPGNPVPDEGTTVPGHLTSQDLPDLASDLAARDPLARHLEIVADQDRLQTRRAVAVGLTREHVEAIRAAGQPWAALAERPQWCSEAAATVAELGLTPAQVGQLLAAWDRAADAAGGAEAVQADRGRASGLPTRFAVWWARWRPWARAQLGLAAPSRSGIGCAPVSAPLLGGRRSW